MRFEIISEIRHVEIIATGSGVREAPKMHGEGRWRKLKGVTTISAAEACDLDRVILSEAKDLPVWHSGRSFAVFAAQDDTLFLPRRLLAEIHWYEARCVGKREKFCTTSSSTLISPGLILTSFDT